MYLQKLTAAPNNHHWPQNEWFNSRGGVRIGQTSLWYYGGHPIVCDITTVLWWKLKHSSTNQKLLPPVDMDLVDQQMLQWLLLIGVGRYWRLRGLKIWMRAKHAQKFQTTPTLGQTAPIFERSTRLRLDFLHKRTNGKSSRADLAAT